MTTEDGIRDGLLSVIKNKGYCSVELRCSVCPIHNINSPCYNDERGLAPASHMNRYNKALNYYIKTYGKYELFEELV